MEYKIQNRRAIGINLKELKQFRELLLIFTWRDLKLKYRQTLLGFAWVILQPLIMMSIFTVIFSTRIDISSTGIPYTVFVFGGLIIWGVFSGGISNGSMSILNQSHIIKKTYFPIIILPASSMLVSVVDFLASLLIFIPLLLIQGIQIDILRFVLYVPVSFILVAIPTLGLVILFAGLNVRYRDVKFIVPFFLQIMLFISPIIYPISIAPSKIIQNILAFNPLSGSIELMRAAVDNTINPDMTIIVQGFIVSLVILISGILVFGRIQKNFADIA